MRSTTAWLALGVQIAAPALMLLAVWLIARTYAEQARDFRLSPGELITGMFTRTLDDRTGMKDSTLRILPSVGNAMAVGVGTGAWLGGCFAHWRRRWTLWAVWLSAAALAMWLDVVAAIAIRLLHGEIPWLSEGADGWPTAGASPLHRLVPFVIVVLGSVGGSTLGRALARGWAQHKRIRARKIRRRRRLRRHGR